MTQGGLGLGLGLEDFSPHIELQLLIYSLECLSSKLALTRTISAEQRRERPPGGEANSSTSATSLSPPERQRRGHGALSSVPQELLPLDESIIWTYLSSFPAALSSSLH